MTRTGTEDKTDQRRDTESVQRLKTAKLLEHLKRFHAKRSRVDFDSHGFGQTDRSDHGGYSLQSNYGTYVAGPLTVAGNSGIGFSLATLLIADSSKHVIIASRSVEKGEAALKELQALKQPGVIEMLQLEVSDPNSIAELAQKIEKQHGRSVIPRS